MSDAARVRREHEPAVLGNQLRLAAGWGRPCLGYHVFVRPGAAAGALARLQAAALALEPSLLRVPARALHANVAWLLPVQQEFGCPKDELWRRHGARWMAALTRVAAARACFRLRFTDLVATDSAVIAVAREPNGLSALRRELGPALDVPGQLTAGQLVHMTLLRYGRPLRDPAGLLRWLESVPLCLDVEVSELLVIRERTFPSLNVDVIGQIALPRRNR
ncbi:MAG TPA: hypothetical protein VH637_24655 [Streptosporangiaceae bacterium]|jgi:hypothetical protein